MSGYIELNRTGFAPFDDALSLIEDAGTAYHHTSQWIEDGWNGEKPYLGQINESIAFAAKSYLNLQEQIATLTQQRDLAVSALKKAQDFVWAMSSSTAQKSRFGEFYYPAINALGEALSAINESEV